MDGLSLIAALLVGLVLALGLGWLAWGRVLASTRGERDAARGEAERWRSEETLARLKLTEAEAERRALEARAAELASAESERNRLAGELAAFEAAAAERDASHARQLDALNERFAALAGAALEGAQAKFAEAAEAALVRHREAAGAGLEANRNQLAELIAPMRETLTNYETQLAAIETARTEAYGGLKEAIDAVGKGQESVRTEAAKLVNALRASPKARGRWGEQQLRNVLEMAGLAEHADFRTEVSVEGDDGRLRPDVIVRLPGGRELVIDAKCSMNSYLDACEATDDVARSAHLAAHAKALRIHADALGRKAYWDQFAGAADYVLMFIPGEQFLSGALEADPGLWEHAFERRVLLATPTNLVAIARTVAVVWRQEQMTIEAKLIGEMARELFRRLAAMGDHVDKLGGNLDRAVKSYNAFVGSLESSVLPQGRKFIELKVETGAKQLPVLEPIETAVRLPSRGRDLISSPPKAAAE